MAVMTGPATSTNPPTPRRPPGPIERVTAAAERATGAAATWLAAHSVTVLRISLGLVFLAFGALKFVPGASPAEALAARTLDTLTFGLLSGRPAVLLTAVMETFIGLTLVSGKWVRASLVAMAASMVGILSPLVLFTADLFPGFVPTLEAQYVFKDIVLVAAGGVVAAHALGARYVLPGRTRRAGR